MAAPVGAVALFGTRRASSATLRNVRLPLTEAAAKPLAMLRWVRPDQIVMLKLLREPRNKNLDFFATFCFHDGRIASKGRYRNGVGCVVFSHQALFRLCFENVQTL